MLKQITARALLESSQKFIPLDATWYPPSMGRDGHEDYAAERIKGAVYFDLNVFKSESPYAYMVPSKEKFAAEMGKLGISNDDVLVVYDRKSFLSAPRVLWLLKTFGHKEAYLLDNWADYKALGGAMETGPPQPRPATNYSVPEKMGPVVTFERMEELATSGKIGKDVTVLDARAASLFSESPSGPPSGPSVGHIPGSVDLPFGEVLENGHYKSPTAIREILAAKHITGDKPIIVSCGSAITACVLKVGVDEALGVNSEVYDGSWSEWSQRAPPSLIAKD